MKEYNLNQHNHKLSLAWALWRKLLRWCSTKRRYIKCKYLYLYLYGDDPLATVRLPHSSAGSF